MSKRSFAESTESQAPDAENNGLLPIHDLLSPDEQDLTAPSGPTKKPRNFIATVVCCRRFEILLAHRGK